MPSKDGAMDDNKKSTKDVVNKKQKQMLNQEQNDPIKTALKTATGGLKTIDKGTKNYNKKSLDTYRKLGGDGTARYAEEYLPEEEYDHYRDRITMAGGDHRSKETRERSYSRSDDDKRKGDTPMQKEFKKKYGKKATALDAVKQKYKGQMMDVKKKSGKDAEASGKDTSIDLKKEELDLTKVAEAFGGYIVLEKLGKEGEFIPDNPDSPFEKGFKKSKEGRRVRKTYTDTKAKAIRDIVRSGGAAEGGTPSQKKDATDILNKVLGKTSVSDPKGETLIKGTSDEKLIRTTSPTGDEGQFKRKARKFRRAKRDPVIANMTDAQKAANIKKVKAGIDAKSPTMKGLSGGKLPAKYKNVDMSYRGVKSTKKILNAPIEKPVKKGFKDFVKGLSAKNIAQSKNPAGFTSKTVGKSFKSAAKLGLRPAITKQVVKGTAKTAASAGGRFALKRIPGIGLAISAGEAGARAASGDYVGAAIAGAEGIASMVPVLGTGVSAALGAVGLARDVRRAGKVTRAASQVYKQARKSGITKGSKAFTDFRKFKPKNVNLKVPFQKGMNLKAKNKILGADTVSGAGFRSGGAAMAMDMMMGRNRGGGAGLPPVPRVDTGIVGKRTAG